MAGAYKSAWVIFCPENVIYTLTTIRIFFRFYFFSIESVDHLNFTLPTSKKVQKRSNNKNEGVLYTEIILPAVDWGNRMG